jgi:hypothetical protein
MLKQLQNFIGVLLLVLIAARPTTLLADPSNLGPPAGPAIFDLAGQPIPFTYNHYSATFTAASSDTDLIFALRNDPAFWGLDDISIVDTNPGSVNLVANGGFETGDSSGWQVVSVPGQSSPGFVGNTGTCSDTAAPHSGTWDWCDGAGQAYDTIDQHIATTVGDSYTVSFWLSSSDNHGVATIAQQQSTNGGENGIDVLVYALPAPEPVSLLLFGSGLTGIGLLSSNRTKKA